MGGVNRMDQNVRAYMINIRNKKWWWPLSRFCIDLAVINAHQLYCLQPLHLAKERLIYWDFEGKLSKSTVQSIGMSIKFYLISSLPHEIIKRLSQIFVMIMKVIG